MLDKQHFYKCCVTIINNDNSKTTYKLNWFFLLSPKKTRWLSISYTFIPDAVINFFIFLLKNFRIIKRLGKHIEEISSISDESLRISNNFSH